MIGKLIGAFAGAQAAKHTRSLGGAGGAILGAIAVPVVRRMKIAPLLALGIGGYIAKKLIDKERAEATPPSSSKPEN